MYTKSGKVLESTYNHDIMDPIEKFILWDLCEISHQWDSSTIQATKVRNGIPYDDLNNKTFYKSVMDMLKALYLIQSIIKKNLELIKRIETSSLKINSNSEGIIDMLKTYDND
ncbi:10989_t:CDS:2 [Entrophospora sp. SA101]|nr:10989_t:CDS:2 [Entrophospora sp. SA101]